MVGDRGMIRTDQKAAAQAADFHFITALTKPQIQKLLTDQVLQMELFEDKASKEHPRAKAQTQRRTLERVWCSLEITIKDGLRKLEKLCVMELVHPQSGDVVARQVSDLSPRQKQLLDPLKLGLPATVPEAQLLVGFVE